MVGGIGLERARHPRSFQQARQFDSFSESDNKIAQGAFYYREAG